MINRLRRLPEIRVRFGVDKERPRIEVTLLPITSRPGYERAGHGGSAQDDERVLRCCLGLLLRD